jgi:hypothetical protein
MEENLGIGPAKRGPISKFGPSDAAEGMQFPRRWNGGTIFLNFDVRLGNVG